MLHPMQRSIGKDSVEWFAEGEALPVHHDDIQASFTVRPKVREASIDANDTASCCCDFFREHAVTAAEIQDHFARLRIKELQERCTEISNKARGFGVAVGIPRRRLTHRELR